MRENILKNLLNLRNKLLIKNFFNLIELIMCNLCRLLNYENKIFSNFQVFSNGKLISRLRIEKSKKLNFENDKTLNELNLKSFSYLGRIEINDVNQAKRYFFNQEKIYNSHIPNLKKNNQILMKDFLVRNDSNYGSFDIQTSLKCPNLENISKDFKFKEISEKYLNSKKIKIYSINTMLTKKTKNLHDVTKLHRDFDSSNSLVFFIYWTKVDKNNGATSLIPGSHLYDHNKNFHKNFSDTHKLEYLEGVEGSIFCLDTWAYHRGNPNIINPRLVTWIRFTAVPAKTYYIDENYIFKNDLKNFNSKIQLVF